MRPRSGFVTAVPAALALVLVPPALAQRSADRKIDSLLARMTLEEKLGQLNQLSVDGQPSAEQLDLVRKGLVGSLFNLTGAEATRAAQRIAVTDSRLHIPLIFGQDVIHGYRTIFPIPLGEAASWDPEAVQAAAHVAAAEAAAAGLHWTFAPMVDIARDPRWGRIAEGSGEDPYLGSALAAARVRGFQGTNPRAPDAVLATVKHFAAYAGAAGRPRPGRRGERGGAPCAAGQGGARLVRRPLPRCHGRAGASRAARTRAPPAGAPRGRRVDRPPQERRTAVAAGGECEDHRRDRSPRRRQSLGARLLARPRRPAGRRDPARRDQ